MKGFRFRLARVLRVRRIEEQLTRARFLELQREAQQAEEHLAEGAEQARSARAELVDQIGSGPLDPRSVLRGQESVESMEALCARRQERARTRWLQAEEAREPWSNRRKGVRTLETLEHKQSERFRSEQEKRANRELDEIASRRVRDRFPATSLERRKKDELK